MRKQGNTKSVTVTGGNDELVFDDGLALGGDWEDAQRKRASLLPREKSRPLTANGPVLRQMLILAFGLIGLQETTRKPGRAQLSAQAGGGSARWQLDLQVGLLDPVAEIQKLAVHLHQEILAGEAERSLMPPVLQVATMSCLEGIAVDRADQGQQPGKESNGAC